MPVVSISDAQRDPLPNVNWLGTVYHGLPQDQYTFHNQAGKYLAFLGRISPEKGVDRAIEIASSAGVPLKIAAKVDRADQEYFETKIRPLLNNPLVEFIGEIGYPEKNEFLGNALALLFPIDWPEPFGLVMIEAMACGTPVLGYATGGIPEVIGPDGHAGRLARADDVNDLGRVLVEILHNPAAARQLARHGLVRVRALFDPQQAADRYEQLFSRL